MELGQDNDGSLWGWGNNRGGQLGDGTEINKYIPTKILDNVRYVTCSDASTYAILNDGSLYGSKCAINADQSNKLTLKLTKLLDDVKYIACGKMFLYTLIVRSDNSLWGCGDNYSGQLGVENSFENKIIDTWTKIMDNVKEVSCGYSSTRILKNDGTLWCCGRNTDNAPAGYIPQKFFDNVKHIVCGRYHSVAIRNDGSLWGWGSNCYKGCLDGSEFQIYKPKKLASGVKSVACGDTFTIYITNDGELMIYGEIM